MSQEGRPAANPGAQTTGLSLAEKRALAERLLQKKAGSVTTVYPQSYSQRAMWFMHQMDPQSPAYHVAFAARIRSAVDDAALERAVQRLVDRHPALRTTFSNGELAGGESGPVQTVAGYRQAGLQEVDASTWDEEELRDQVLAAYVQPFDLEHGPAVRVTLFRQEGGHVLLMVAHHIVMDGWSVGVYLNELLSVYASEVRAETPSLPPVTGRYADYVTWQQQLLAGPEGERLWRYWQGALGRDLPALALPYDYARPVLQSHEGATSVLTIDRELTVLVRKLARSEGVTLYMLMLAAFYLLLSTRAGQEEVVIGSPMAGRNQAAWAGVIGDFVNMVPVRLCSSAQQSFRELLAHVRQQVLAGLDHQEYPFALLVERLVSGRRDRNRSPIFQVSFDLQRLQRFGPLAPLFLPYAPDAQVIVGGLTLAPYFFPQQEGQFDLGLQLAEADDEIIGAIKYSTTLFDPETIVGLQVSLLAILRQVAADPTLTVARIRAQAAARAGEEDGEDEVDRLLAELRGLDIKLWVDGEKLRVNAPAGRLSAELQRAIGEHKVALIARVQEEETAGAPLHVAGEGAGAPTGRGAGEEAGPPLSFAQQRIWFLDQMTQGSVAYHAPLVLRLTGALKAPALERSLCEIVRRHAVLRTRLEVTGGQVKQVVDESIAVALPMVDLQGLPEHEVEAEALRQAQVEASRPLDLTRGPLLRAALIRLRAQEHLLVLTSHQFACDEPSFGLLGTELAALYTAFATNRPSPLGPLPLQYSDFAADQRRVGESERHERDMDYWRRKLLGPLPILDLPTDHPRPPFTSTRGARREASLDASLVSALRTLSRQAGVPLFVTLLAAFETLLYRSTRQEELIVGATVGGREGETAHVIGSFVNTLVLRTDLSGAPTFRALVDRVHAVMQEALDHGSVPFDRLVEALQPARDPSRFPFFQVVFDFDEEARENWEAEGLLMRRQGVDLRTARFDLTMMVRSRAEGLSVTLEYCTDLFEEETIRRTLEHYVVLLQAVVADCDRRITELPLLSEEERRLLLVDWNATEVVYPRHLPVHRLFEAQAEQRPDAVAVSCGGQQIRYGELNCNANGLARRLADLGVREGSLVGIYMERSIEMVLALLAVHKAGAAYLPLDPAFPADRLAFMIEDSQAQTIIAHTHLQGQMPPHAAQVVWIDRNDDGNSMAGYAASGADGASPLEDGGDTELDPGERMAYVLYTSGSTGRPKGVQIPQRALVNFLLSMQQAPGMTPEDLLLSVTTLSFDIAGLEIFLPLITGARVEIVSQAVAADGGALLELLQRCGATIMQATPATWRLLLGAGWEGTPGLKILCGGEAMPGELAGQLLGRCASLWNMYGPTETTIWSTVYRVKQGEGVMPIGRPIANTQVYVLDEAGQPAPIGVPGELYIGGDGVALGYLKRPELTAEKFVVDPFAGGGATMYRTGDLARFRSSGDLDFLGRMDFQVKVRGFRIELGEIEAVLDEHPAVRQAVVMAREDKPGDVRLVAYLAAAGAVPPAADLRGYLKEKLPDYMVPAVYVTVDSFPLTPNGKVNRKELPAPAAGGAETSAHYVAPRTETEQKVAAIWRNALDVERVGVTDNFFDLGGHSLLVIQVHTQLRRNFATNLTVAQMFQYPTVEALAAQLERPQAAAGNLQGAQERAARQRAQLGRAGPRSGR